MKQLYSLLFFLLLSHLLVAQECDGISGDITPDAVTICQGQSIVLTATGGSSYEWSLDGQVIAGETTSTLTATQAGTYTVIIIEGACRVPASNSATVTVTQLPSGTITPANAAICPGSEVTLTASGGTSYTWFLDGVEINGENNATIDADQAGTYTVTINNNGCSAPASNNAVVTQTAAPTGTITPATAGICPGGSTTLTATGGTSYTWFRNGNEINGQTGATLNVTQQGTYSVIINQNGCSGPASNTASVTNTSAPNGNITPANTSICPGGSTTLTATGGTSYTWFRNGTEITGQTGATLVVNQAGTYTATIHQGSCSEEANNSSTVTLATPPSGNITPANASICPGGNTTLTATGGTSYTWFRNGVQINGQTGETLTVTQGGTYTVNINNNGCTAPASNNSVVTVTAAPTGAITPAVAAVCLGGATVLTATGGTSYTWFLNGNEIDGETGAELTVTQAGIYSAIIRNGDCSGPASNTSVVTITALPVGTISPAAGSICTGGTIELTATGGTSYTWFRNGTEIAGQTESTLSATEPGTYFVIIRQGTCSGPALNTSIITVATPPTGSISPATAAICAGGSTTLTATGGTSYTWFRDGVEIAGQTAATLNVPQGGTYTATIIQGGCTAPATNSSTVTVTPLPSGTISPATASICEGGSVTLTATGGTSYKWFRNGNQIAGQTAATLNATEAGTYTATIINGTCSATASNSSVVTIGAGPTGEITPATASICEGGAVTLTATGGNTYQWFRNGVEISGQTAATLNVTQEGTYTATIQQGSCSGEASNSSVVTVGAAPTGTITPATAAICGGGSQTLTATGGTSYIWMRDGAEISGETGATITVSQAGTYSVTINSGSCTGPASNTSTITIEDGSGTRYDNVNARPGVGTQLAAREIGASYEWTPATDLDNPTSRTPTVTTNTDREYVVKITTANGCVIMDTVLVKVRSQIFVPTGFTPNRNGANDLLRPIGEMRSFDFKVFNRWGQLMFQTTQAGAGWDGKFKGVDQPGDTYTWLLSGVGNDGVPFKISGKSLLIR